MQLSYCPSKCTAILIYKAKTKVQRLGMLPNITQIVKESASEFTSNSNTLLIILTSTLREYGVLELTFQTAIKTMWLLLFSA